MPDTVKAGIGFALLLQVLEIAGWFIMSTNQDLGAILVFSGISQIVYLLPAALVTFVTDKTRFSQGILIVMGLRFLLSAAICGKMIVVRHPARP